MKQEFEFFCKAMENRKKVRKENRDEKRRENRSRTSARS